MEMEQTYTERWTHEDQAPRAPTPEPPVDPAVIAARPIKPMRARRTVPASVFAPTPRKRAGPAPRPTTGGLSLPAPAAAPRATTSDLAPLAISPSSPVSSADSSPVSSPVSQPQPPISQLQPSTPSPYTADTTPAYVTVVGSSRAFSLPSANSIPAASVSASPAASPYYVPTAIRKANAEPRLPPGFNRPDLPPSEEYAKIAKSHFVERTPPRGSMTDPAAINQSLSSKLDALQAAKAKIPATMGQGLRESVRNAELVKERNSEKNRADFLLKKVNDLERQMETMKLQQAEEEANSPEPVRQLKEARAEVVRLTNLLAVQTQNVADEKGRADGAEMAYGMEESLHEDTKNAMENVEAQLVEASECNSNLLHRLDQLTDESADWKGKFETVNMNFETSQRNLHNANVELHNARQLCETLTSEKLQMEQHLASEKARLNQAFTSANQSMKEKFNSDMEIGVKERVATRVEELKQWKSARETELKESKSKFETELKSKYEAELEEFKSKCEADLKSKYEVECEEFKSNIELTCKREWSERLAKANTDKESAERQLAFKNEEIRNLTTAKENAERQLAHKDEAIRNVNKKLTKHVATSDSIREELGKEIAGLKGALQTAIAEKSSIAPLTASASRAPAVADRLQAQTVDRLMFTIEKLETQVKDAARDLKFVKELHGYDMKCLKFEKRQSRQLRLTITSLEKRNSNSSERKVMAEGLQRELADTKADLDRINSSLSDSVRDHATLQADFRRVQEEKSELETKLASVKGKLWTERVLLKIERGSRAYTGPPIIIEEDLPQPASIPRPRDDDDLPFDERLHLLLGDNGSPPPRSVVPAPSVALPSFVPVSTQTDETPATPPEVPDSHTASTQTESFDTVREGAVPVDLGSTSPRWFARFRSIDLRFLYAVVFLFSIYACFVLGVGYDSWYRDLTEDIPVGYELRYPAFTEAVSPLRVRLSAKWLDRAWHRCLDWFFEDVLG